MIKKIEIIYEAPGIDKNLEELLKTTLEAEGFKCLDSGYGFGERDLIFYPIEEEKVNDTHHE